MAQELCVSITYNGPRYAMKSHYFLKEEIGNMSCIINFVAWNKVGHFRKSIHYHKDGIPILSCPWEP